MLSVALSIEVSESESNKLASVGDLRTVIRESTGESTPSVTLAAVLGMTKVCLSRATRELCSSPGWERDFSLTVTEDDMSS